MKNIAKFSVEKAITVFMAVIVVIVFGVVSYTRISTDLFPSMNIPYAIVVTTYVGASPEEVEEEVTKPLEATLATTTNISTITSQSQENVSLVILEFNSDANMDSVVIEMRENLDMVTSSFADEVGSPMIIKLNPDMMPIMQFSVSSADMDQIELTSYVNDEVLPLIERIAGVASVDVSGAYESEVRVVLDDSKLEDLNDELEALYLMMDPDDNMEDMYLDKDLISDILAAQNFAFPVGYAELQGVNYLVRVGDEFADVDEINDLILFDMSSQIILMLDGVLQGMGYSYDEIDTVPSMILEQPMVAMLLHSSFIEPITLESILLYDVDYVDANEREYTKINGNNSISITVQKSANFATTDVTNELLTVISGIEETDDVDFTILLDQGEYINQSTGSVTDNLLIGAVLAVFVLVLFLRSFRATFIVGVAIPISLLFAIILIYLSGITLNIVSLGGLALGIGMLVDNSIVVMENIFRMKKLGHSNKEAAIEGTKQVGGAIMASTITTIAVFVPIIFIEGFIKEIFMQMALTITFSLLASLMIALTLVPAISSKILKENEGSKEEKGINAFKKGYEAIFKFMFRFKYIVLVVVMILFGGSIYLAYGNGFEYFPASDEGQLNIDISNPNDAPLTYEEFVVVLDDLTGDLMEYEDVDTVGATLGSLQGSFLGIGSSDSASISVILSDDRTKTTGEYEALFTTLLSNDYSEIEFAISGSQQQTSMLTGSGLQIELHGNDLATLKEEAIKIADVLNTVDGLTNVDNGVGRESEEVKITVDKDVAISYNVMNAVVMGVVAQSIAPEEVVTEISVEGSLYNIYVYGYDPENPDPEDIIDTLEEIEGIIVGSYYDTDLGETLPVTVGMVASVEYVKGFTTINRVDGSRTITISAEYEDGVNTTEVAAAAEQALNDDYTVPTNYEYIILGENEEVMEAVNVLLLAIVLAIALIYMVMASQFQSLTYPFIIMFTIPLAFTGGFAILWLANMTISVVALIGFVILIGVVVNNGIVLVDYTNQLREEGYSVNRALLEAGKTRLRPIIMTALTTILALSTMALGFGQGSEMMQPMAVTTVGGLLYATILTLFIVPIMYYLVTNYAKQIFGYGIGVILLLGAGASYYVTSNLYILIGVAVLGVLLITFTVITTSRNRGETYE
jgi:HAE1 family hydrophobic/amphiphilic exporter-1